MDYHININGIDVDAVYGDDVIEHIFKPLLFKLSDIRKEKNRRILVMLAAPPGAGKSTLVSFLESISKTIIPQYKVQSIGMDGFHRRQEYLTSHKTMVDGREVLMVDVKGCPVTFDLELLKKRIRLLLDEVKCSWPAYDRHLHNPVEDAIAVDGDIILLEGNYLLLDEDGWDELSDMADYTISIKADQDMLRDRLVDRKEKSGNTRSKAEQFVDFSDMRNVRLCLEHTKKADMELFVKADGSICLTNEDE